MTEETGGEKFVCALCDQTFACGCSEAEAEAELRSEFGDVPKEECAVVCDDCWAKIHPRRN